MLHAESEAEISALRAEVEAVDKGEMPVKQADIDQMLALREMLGRKTPPEQD